MVEFYTNPRGWRARQKAAQERIEKKGSDGWEAVREQRRQHRERVAQGLSPEEVAETTEDASKKKRKKKRKRIDGEEKSAKKTKPNKPKPGSRKKPSSKKRRKVDHAEA